MRSILLMVCLVGVLVVAIGVTKSTIMAQKPALVAASSGVLLAPTTTPIDAAASLPGNPDDLSVVGQPTLSVALMNRILARYHSPAAGTAQTLFDLSRSSQIDDAFALAFFKHESVFGTLGWAKVNRSLGNIRCEPQYPCNGGYAQYPTWQDSYRDWFRLIHDLYIGEWHLTTVRSIVHRYAPAADNNDEDAYVRSVVAEVQAWRRGEVQ